jgi:hypothetical protein
MADALDGYTDAQRAEHIDTQIRAWQAELYGNMLTVKVAEANGEDATQANTNVKRLETGIATLRAERETLSL